MKVLRLSALSSGRLYSPGNIASTHFCYGLSRLQGHSVAIGNRTRDLPARNPQQLRHRVPQQTLQCITLTVR